MMMNYVIEFANGWRYASKYWSGDIIHLGHYPSGFYQNQMAIRIILEKIFSMEVYIMCIYL